MLEPILTVIGTLVASGLFAGFGTAVYKSFKNRGHRSDNAWNQRNLERVKAQDYFEALMTHRTLCHTEHGMAYEDMPPRPDYKYYKKE